MKAHAPKNRALIAQYPFISRILKMDLPPFGDSVKNQIAVDDLTITVERADGELMYRQADNIGNFDGSLCFHAGGRHKGQVSRRQEFMMAVAKNGDIINQLVWPRNERERRGKLPLYGRMVMWATRTEDGWATDPLYDQISHLVWVTVTAFHRDSGDAQDRFGAFVERDVRITVYGEPEGGFRKLHDDASVFEYLPLNADVVTRAVVEKDTYVMLMTGRLDELCTLFQDEVYLNGMQQVLDDGNVRGASGQLGPVKVLCAEVCGYERVMLQDDACWISFQLREKGGTMYVLGMSGTLPRLRNLVKSAVRAWNEQPEARRNFAPDTGVSVI